MVDRRAYFESEVPGLLAHILGDQLPPNLVSGLAMVASRLYSLEARVWEPRRLPPIYERLIPIDTTDGECAIGRAYTIMERHGDTKEIARGADDLPLVEVGTAEDRFIPFKIGGLGYTYDTEDVRQAACLGNFSRISVLPQKAFDIYEWAMNEHALWGNTRGGKLGFKDGLFTSSQIPIVAGPSFSSPPTAQELIDALLMGGDSVWTTSGNTSYANTLCIPQALMQSAVRMKLGDGCCESVLDYVGRINQTTSTTGEELQIIAVRGLETAGANGGPRIMAFERNAENLVLPIPMPLRFHAPQIRNLTFVVPAEYKYGPVHFRFPKSAVYIDFPPNTNFQSAKMQTTTSQPQQQTAMHGTAMPASSTGTQVPQHEAARRTK